EMVLGGVREAPVVDEGQDLGLRSSRRAEVPAPVPERGRHRASAHRVPIPATGAVLDPHALASDYDRHRPPELQGQHVRAVAVDPVLDHGPSPPPPAGTACAQGTLGRSPGLRRTATSMTMRGVQRAYSLLSAPPVPVLPCLLCMEGRG